MKCLTMLFLLIGLTYPIPANALSPVEQEVLQVLNQDEMSSQVIDRFRRNSQDWVPVLEKVASGNIRTSNYQVSNAVFVLGKLGDHKAVPALERALDNADEKVRSSSLRALGRIQSTKSLAVLNRFLEKPNIHSIDAMTAVDALSKIGNRSSINTLERLKSKPIYKGRLKRQVDHTIIKLEQLPQ